jgi:hypothetical protein
LRWPVANTPGWVTANNADPPRAAAKLLTKDEAQRSAANVANVPELFRRTPTEFLTALKRKEPPTEAAVLDYDGLCTPLSFPVASVTVPG